MNFGIANVFSRAYASTRQCKLRRQTLAQWVSAPHQSRATHGHETDAHSPTANKIEYEELTSKSKHTIDEIDHLLAQHYGFTDKELDSILNSDIKYRLDLDKENDDE